MRKLKKFIALGFAFYIISCGKTDTSVNLYEPTIADATSTTTLAQLPNMASRTNLTSAQIVLVTKYVTRGK